MTRVSPWVRELTEEVFGGAPFAVGDEVTAPSGRKVKIVDGQYWGIDGISNFWYWREIRADGSLGPSECGYSGDFK